MKKLFLIPIFLFFAFQANAQEVLRLETCYDLAETHYPKAKKSTLISQQTELNKEVIKTRKLPKIELDAQATYQSDVISFPIDNPAFEIELPNKDQYRGTLTLNQLIYGGGAVDAAIEQEDARAKAEMQKVQVALYQLKPLINQLYFSILLQQEKKALLEAKQKQLTQKLKEVKAGVKYGAVLPSSDAVLEAELMKIEQQLTETETNRKNLIQTLEKYVGKPIAPETQFEYPQLEVGISGNLHRPETELFNLQKSQIDQSLELVKKDRIPKLYGFAQGGYGNPGINPLDNSFQTFYYVGVKLNWNVFDWQKTKKKTQALEINKQIIDSEQQEFELKTNVQLQQQELEIKKYEEFIRSDQTIIDLRKQILRTAESQLKNGVITSSDYVEKLTDLYESETNLKTHQIQLLLSKANYKVIQGI